MTQHNNDEELFAAALIMPTGERAHFLARACADDAVTRDRLSDLLAAFDDAVDFVRVAPLSSESPLDEIRSYRLLRELGEGGCGIAYLAEQLAPVKRQVAVKVIKPGMDTKAVVARFEAERQLLALMDHPNVAKVFDAGSTAAGRPYFVMELVRGITITEYSELMQLSIAERLQLFIQVCQAIQHAHHKGVMHRDIKPSNVLVTMHDGVPLVKVIDFGIAKATQGPLSERTAHTALEQLVGTPAYISPEQTELTQRNVDTRSDIYSLGVLLYELLTVCTPLDSQELLQSSAEELRRRVREEEPPTPSARLKAMQRSAKGVQGDLDWIVMRSLEKEPGRRYQTVNDLLLDIQRHLRHEPVTARPPSLYYVIAKFGRRNRAMAAAVLVAALLVTAMVVNTSIQSQRVAAEKERALEESQRAEKVAEFMLETLAKAEPFGYAETGQPESANELLDRAGRWLHQNPNLDSELRARLLEAVGRGLRHIGQPKTALPYTEDALRIRRTSHDPDGTRTQSSLIELAATLRQVNDLQGADNAMQQALAISREHRGQRTETYAELLLNLGRVQVSVGNLADARKNFEDSLALYRELRGPMDPQIAGALAELAAVHAWNDDLSSAEQCARQALQIFTATLPPAHPDRIFADGKLAEILLLQNRIDEAGPLFLESLVMRTQLFGANSVQVADALDSLAKIRSGQGLLAEAEDYSRRALRTHIAAAGREHRQTGYLQASLALTLERRGNYKEAEQLALDSLQTFAKTLPPDHQYVAASEHILGEVLVEARHFARAESILRTAMQRWQRTNAGKWRVARTESALGEAVYRQGRVGEAEHYLSESYWILATQEAAERSAQIKARERLVRFYTERGRLDKVHALTATGTVRLRVAAER